MKVLLLTLSMLAAGSLLANEAAIKVFKEIKCTDCHSISAQKIEKIKGTKEKSDGKTPPPDLSAAGAEHDAAWIADYLNKKVDLKGKKHKKKFQGSPEELKTLTDWLATLKSKA